MDAKERQEMMKKLNEGLQARQAAYKAEAETRKAKTQVVETKQIANAKPKPQVEQAQPRRPIARAVSTASGWTEDEEDGIAPNPVALSMAQASEAQKNIEARQSERSDEANAFAARCAKMVAEFRISQQYPSMTETRSLTQQIADLIAAL